MREERDADRDNMKEILWSKESARKREWVEKRIKKKLINEKKSCQWKGKQRKTRIKRGKEDIERWKQKRGIGKKKRE